MTDEARIKIAQHLQGRIDSICQHHGFSYHTGLAQLKHRRGESRERFLLRVTDYGVMRELQDILYLMKEGAL